MSSEPSHQDIVIRGGPHDGMRLSVSLNLLTLHLRSKNRIFRYTRGTELHPGPDEVVEFRYTGSWTNDE